MRTCTTMLMTDGTITLYGVFRGRMRGKSFDLQTAEQIGTIKTTQRPFDYAAHTALYATADAPAVYWQVQS